MAGARGSDGLLPALLGFSLGHGGRRVLLPIVFGGAGLLPGVLAQQGRHATCGAIDAELPHFVDQLAIDHRGRHELRCRGQLPRGRGEGPLGEEMRGS